MSHASECAGKQLALQLVQRSRAFGKDYHEKAFGGF
jgi:hypothetical protein